MARIGYRWDVSDQGAAGCLGDRAAAREELAAATPRPLNAFKVELAQRAIVRALSALTSGDTR
jgi:xanthine dehydrogenase YagS FAD-binding subunit